jgi:hypothetical protein
LFFAAASVACAVVVFVGFAKTYFLATRFGGPPLDPLRELHGAAFTAWIVLFLVQTALIAGRHVRVHRRLGIVGAVVAAVMVALGLTLAIETVRDRAMPDLFKGGLLALAGFDMLDFAVLVAAGLLLRRSPDAHKRLMLLATFVLLAAPASRFPFRAADSPLFYFGCVDVFVLALLGYDLACRRRVHAATGWGGALVVLSQPGRIAIAYTAAWAAFVHKLL